MAAVNGQGTLVKVAPGVYLNPFERRDIEPGEHGYVLLDDKGLARLGLSATQSKTLQRLDHCGLIKLYQITPRRKLLLLSSWEEHLKQVREDPEFWERPAMRRKWRVACLAM